MKPKRLNGTDLGAEHLAKLKTEAEARKAQLIAQLQQLQSTANQLVGNINKVSGEIEAIDRMMGAGK